MLYTWKVVLEVKANNPCWNCLLPLENLGQNWPPNQRTCKHCNPSLLQFFLFSYNHLLQLAEGHHSPSRSDFLVGWSTNPSKFSSKKGGRIHWVNNVPNPFCASLYFSQAWVFLFHHVLNNLLKFMYFMLCS